MLHSFLYGGQEVGETGWTWRHKKQEAGEGDLSLKNLQGAYLSHGTWEGSSRNYKSIFLMVLLRNGGPERGD